MNLFYSKNIIKKNIILDNEESRHCLKVLRQKVGDIINITDGKGNIYSARIIDDDIKACKAEIIRSEIIKEKDFYLHIAVSLTKNIDRFEWFLEKAAEIGINEITPLITKKTERKIFKHDRSEKILISAMKQSLDAYLVKLNNTMTLDEILKIKFDGQKFIAYCNEKEVKHLKNLYKKGENALILIGPEGDFTADEVNESLSEGFSIVSLGNKRLRTETAGVMACSIINILNE
jgi:16S rRNA (uracil1498-N3)-methyltransferase